MFYEPNKCYPFDTYDILNGSIKPMNVNYYTLLYEDLISKDNLILNFNTLKDRNLILFDFNYDVLRQDEIYTGAIIIMIPVQNIELIFVNNYNSSSLAPRISTYQFQYIKIWYKVRRSSVDGEVDFMSTVSPLLGLTSNWT